MGSFSLLLTVTRPCQGSPEWTLSVWYVKRAGLPVILCTGYSEKIDSESAEKQSIHYLSKPIDSENCFTLLHEILSFPQLKIEY